MQLGAEQGYTPYLHAGARLGWQNHVMGHIEVVEIPGSHVSMLTEPGLTQLARALRAQLDKGGDGPGIESAGGRGEASWRAHSPLPSAATQPQEAGGQ